MTSNDWILFSLKAFFAAVGLIATILFVVLPLWRMLRSGPDPDILNPQYLEPEEDMDSELEIPTGGERKTPARDEIIKAAKQDPRMTATVITRWLREKN